MSSRPDARVTPVARVASLASSSLLPTLWQKVMFDPLSYIHPERLCLAPGFDAPAQRAAVNRLLIARYDLLLMPVVAPVSTATLLLLQQWPVLPRIVLLLGCQRMRLALARQGAILSLPRPVREFLALPLLASMPLIDVPSLPQQPQARQPHVPSGQTAPDYTQLLQQGLQQLLRCLHQPPPALLQRIALLFAPAFDRDRHATGALSASTHPHPACDPSHALLLRMAIQHVKRTPGQSG